MALEACEERLEVALGGTWGHHLAWLGHRLESMSSEAFASLSDWHSGTSPWCQSPHLGANHLSRISGIALSSLKCPLG